MSLLTFLRESTWGYPIISAIHVLAMAWFGGSALISAFSPELRRFKAAGLAVVLSTGVVLFLLHPALYSNSIFFRIKLVLLIVMARAKPASPLSLALWAAVIFASRGIAFL